MQSHVTQLADSEAKFREAAGRRRNLRKRREEIDERLTEVNVLLERFDLLQKHYASDVERLKGIEEAGTMFASLADANCPLCGALPDHQHKALECEGNTDEVVSAAQAEIAKIMTLQSDLSQTITQLRTEGAALSRRLPRVEQDLSDISVYIENQISPNLRSMRQTYSQLAEKKAEVREALGLYRTVKDLTDRKVLLEAEIAQQSSGSNPDSSLPSSSTDNFAALVLSILKEWHFPRIERLHFEQSNRDLVIDGKSRISFGKGLRAITQAAFSIGLMQFCRNLESPHPGFVILDSPLLSYKEPEGQDDDLRGTDLKPLFYQYLKNLQNDRQVIIIENTEPPPEIQSLPQSIYFTGLPGTGRAGLFHVEPPIPNESNAV